MVRLIGGVESLEFRAEHAVQCSETGFAQAIGHGLDLGGVGLRCGSCRGEVRGGNAEDG